MWTLNWPPKSCSITEWRTWAFPVERSTRKSSPNDRDKLASPLGHDISKQTAQIPKINTEHTTAPQQEISKAPQQECDMDLGIGL